VCLPEQSDHCLQLKESLSLTAVWSNYRQDITDTAVDQWRKCLQTFVCANGGHFEYLLWTNSSNQFAFFFMCFWFTWLLSIMSDFYCVDAWWSI